IAAGDPSGLPASPTAAQITAHLNSLSAMFDQVNNVSNFIVSGPDGGPFNITFINQLAGFNVDELVPDESQALNHTTSSGAVITTVTAGSPAAPTAAQVKAHVNSILSTAIPGAGVTVIGNTGGPFMIAFNGTAA